MKTRGLEYDDRVRKESESLREMGADVRLFVLEQANQARTRRLWGGVEAQSFPLTTRKLFRRGRGLLFKLLEFNVRGLVYVLRSRPNVVWAHNREAGPVVACSLLLREIGWVDRVVWDQHELPSQRTLQSALFRRLWAVLMRSCDRVIVANSERRAFLAEELPRGGDVDFAVLENRADGAFRKIPRLPLPTDLESWLGERPYLLSQGGAHPGRRFGSLVAAVMDHVEVELGLVVVGGRPESEIEAMRRRWGPKFDRRVFFTGWVPQLEMPSLIDHAVASVVLYGKTSANSWLCAPNRLYQAIARGTPVIVGANPPMAELVSRTGVGVVLDGDGASAEDVARAIRTLLDEAPRLKRAAGETSAAIDWNDQRPEIARAGGFTDHSKWDDRR